jgi:hypothetical protein
LEEIFFPEDPIPLYLDKKSETLKILQRVRDEAHRFGVKHHRTRRTNNTIKSELEEIPELAKNHRIASEKTKICKTGERSQPRNSGRNSWETEGKNCLGVF